MSLSREGERLVDPNADKAVSGVGYVENHEDAFDYLHRENSLGKFGPPS